jgi:hypothetical protein
MILAICNYFAKIAICVSQAHRAKLRLGIIRGGITKKAAQQAVAAELLPWRFFNHILLAKLT